MTVMRAGIVDKTASATWVAVAASILIFAISCWATGLGVATLSTLGLLSSNAVLSCGAQYVAWKKWRGVASYMTATAQIGLATASLTGLSYCLATCNLPLRDSTLVALDRAIGLDWVRTVSYLMHYPDLMLLLNWAYASFGYQFVAIPAALFLSNYQQKGSEFVMAWCIALALTVFISPVVPALGGYLYFGIEQRVVPLVRIGAAWLFADSFHLIREGGLRELDPGTLDGIVTFPSFHAAASILFTRACWRVPLLWWPVLVLNGLMWMSAIPIGGHYLVDVMAGSLVAIVAIMAARACAGRSAMRQGTPAKHSVFPVRPSLLPFPLAWRPPIR